MPDRNDPRENDPVVPFARRHRNGANGVRPEWMSPQHVPMSEINEHVDLVAVQADDELVNALASGMTVSAPGIYGYDTDDQVASILAAWKADVDAEPIPELIDLDAAVAAIRAASAPPSRRIRHLAPVAAAAAFLVLTIGGVSVGSASAEPDSFFWPVSKVLFAERAGSIEAADRAETHITAAKAALAQGKPDLAVQELHLAQADLGQVRPQEGKAQLAAVQSFLEAKADETPPGVAVDPGAPLHSDRARPVPTGAAMSQSPDASVAASPPSATQAPTTPEPTSKPAGGPHSGGAAGATSSAEPSPTPEGSKDPTPQPTATPEGQPEAGTPSSTTTTGMGTTTSPAPPG